MNNMVGKRAISVDQKQARRETVLGAARVLFVEAGFFDISMSMIAKRAKMAKGTVYLYFKTKEEVFLTLSEKEITDWLYALEEKLTSASLPLSNEDFVSLYCETMNERQPMLRLTSLLHLVLEKNVTYDEVLAFKKRLLVHSLRVGEKIEKTLPFLKEDQGVALITQFHSSVVGWGQMCEISPVVSEVLENEELAAFKFDLETNLYQSLLLILEGVKAKGGQVSPI
jgi:AcrR family transcriptional regulator